MINFFQVLLSISTCGRTASAARWAPASSWRATPSPTPPWPRASTSRTRCGRRPTSCHVIHHHSLSRGSVYYACHVIHHGVDPRLLSHMAAYQRLGLDESYLPRHSPRCRPSILESNEQPTTWVAPPSGPVSRAWRTSTGSTTSTSSPAPGRSDWRSWRTSRTATPSWCPW